MADGSSRRGANRPHLRRLPVLCLPDPPADTSSANHPYHVALHGMGVDIVGPLPKAHGGLTHVFVVVDMFTKSIEARPLTKITSAQAVDFFCDILHRGGQHHHH